MNGLCQLFQPEAVGVAFHMIVMYVDPLGLVVVGVTRKIFFHMWHLVLQIMVVVSSSKVVVGGWDDNVGCRVARDK